MEAEASRPEAERCTGSRNLFVTLRSGGRRIGARLGVVGPRGRAEITLKTGSAFGIGTAGFGGLRVVRARTGCGKWRLRGERPSAALLFVSAGRLSFAPCSGSEEVYSDYSSDKAEWGGVSGVGCLPAEVEGPSALAALGKEVGFGVEEVPGAAARPQ